MLCYFFTFCVVCFGGVAHAQVIMWDQHTQSAAAELKYKSTVLDVRMTDSHVVVALADEKVSGRWDWFCWFRFWFRFWFWFWFRIWF
jgi:hypothetical protein